MLETRILFFTCETKWTFAPFVDGRVVVRPLRPSMVTGNTTGSIRKTNRVDEKAELKLLNVSGIARQN